jgi:hypothetical protein
MEVVVAKVIDNDYIAFASQGISADLGGTITSVYLGRLKPGGIEGGAAIYYLNGHQFLVGT